MPKNRRSSSAIAGGHRRVSATHRLSRYLAHPTSMESQAYSHSRSASSGRPEAQYRAASAARASTNPGARLETARNSSSAPRRSPSSASASAAFDDAKATPSARNLASRGEDPERPEEVSGLLLASLKPCALCRYASRAAAQSPDCARAFAL